MLDYIRGIFSLDFCTPRYLIMRELGLEKLQVNWGIRARKYEEKIRKMEDARWVKIYWKEKKERGWEDRYGKEKEHYYNMNRLGLCAIDSMAGEERDLIKELKDREIYIQK